MQSQRSKAFRSRRRKGQLGKNRENEEQVDVEAKFLKAVRKSQLSHVIKMLGEMKVDPSADKNKAVQIAAANGCTDIVKVLLSDPRVDPSANNNYAIRYAASKGHTETVALLLALDDPRVCPAANDNHAICLASYNGHHAVVKLLLQHADRIDPGADDDFPIRWACSNGHADVVQSLLSSDRVNPNAKFSFAFRNAMLKDHVDVVKLLLQDKRLKLVREVREMFVAAIGKASVQMAKLLLSDARFDPSVNDNQAIQLAHGEQNKEIVDLLVRNKDVRYSIQYAIPNTPGSRLVLSICKERVRNAIETAKLSVGIYHSSLLQEVDESIKIYVLTLAFGNDVLVMGQQLDFVSMCASMLRVHSVRMKRGEIVKYNHIKSCYSGHAALNK